MASELPTVSDPVQAFISRARTQWRTANEAEAENRAEGFEDLRFLNLDQWPDRIKQLRSTPGRERPCLTIDQIGEPFRQLTNKQRESRPAIHINPEDGEANEATAEVLQGLIRAIEYDSDAQIAYATAFEGAVGIGWGYARLRAEYDGDGPHQNLLVDMIENPFAVYLDPGTQKWDRRDMRYAFVVSDVPRDDYMRLYKKSAVAQAGASLMDFSGLGDEAKDWFPQGAVRIAEYYYIDDEVTELAEMEVEQQGSVLNLQTTTQTVKVKDAPKGAKLENRREIRKPVVKWAKINGLEILEGSDDLKAGRRIPGKTIPIRPCYGQVLNVNGKRVYRGIVRSARDPQRQYNYQNSALVEEMALAPKSKVIMAEGQDEDHETMWESANVENYPYLVYKPTTLGEKLIGPPNVVQFTDPAKIQSIVIAINQAKQDLRSTTGWYDATDPTRKNADQSGKAINARKQATDQGSVNYLDNFNRFVTSLGKLSLEWIPELYDGEARIIRTLGMEDEVELVMINAPHQDTDGVPQRVDEQAARLIKNVQMFDLRKGTYGVKVSPGTSYTTRKQEAAEWQFRLLEARPELMGVFGDIAFRNLDGPGHEQIADRIEKTIPPQIKGDDQQQPDPAQLQAQIAQAQQVMQAMQAELMESKRLNETQGIKAQADLQKQREVNAKELQIAQLEAEVAAMQARVDLIKLQKEINADLAQTAIVEESKRMKMKADLVVGRENADRESFERDKDRQSDSYERDQDRQVTRESAKQKETIQ